MRKQLTPFHPSYVHYVQEANYATVFLKVRETCVLSDLLLFSWFLPRFVQDGLNEG